VAKQRAFRIKGGGFDFDKAAVALLTDYRSGALGRISLETPATRAAMLAGPPRVMPVQPEAPEEDE
jgi:ribosome biogenesis GTPase A